jgi:hypothetical protein
MINRTKYIILVLILFAIIDGIYTKLNYSAKSTRLACHTDVVTFEKVFQQDMISILVKSLKSNNYQINIKADKAIYMKSVMFNYVNIDDIKENIIRHIKEYSSKLPHIKSINENNKVILEILVYENDKLDPGKKTKKSKLYAGYIEITAKIKNKVIYKIQMDFLDLKGKDIPKRISCITKSIMSFNK